MVHGGRSRRVRVVSVLGSFGALGLVGTAGCGSRTSVLDPDGYALGFSDTTDTGGTGSIVGNGGAGGRQTPTPTAGSPVIGTGGSGPTTSGGKGGTGGLDTSLSIAPCQRYCPGYGTECAARLMGQNCFDACQGEINGFGAKCQGPGINALQCLTPFFNATDNDCDAAVARALTKCGTIVNAFEKCKGVKPTPAPTPTPTPTPMPTPTPIVDVSTCGVSGGADPTSCNAIYACPNGQYSLVCKLPGNANLADCICTSPNGQQNFGEVMTMGKPCFAEARSLCR